MRRCEGRVGAIGALLLLAIAAPAVGSTRSQQLVTQALIPFHAQRWSDAQALLDRAVTADPEDAVAVYYRGLTNARLGMPDKAIADIEHALSLRPDLQPAVLDLGILYFERGQYAPAQQWLQRAYRQPATRFSAAFFLGLTALRRGDARAAVPLFEEAAKDPALRNAAQYYQAIALLRTGSGTAGRQLLTQVQSGPAEAETTQIARQYLSGPAPIAAPGPVTPLGKPWSVYAVGGFGYDSNVTLTPDNKSLSAVVPGNANVPPNALPMPGETLVNCYTKVEDPPGSGNYACRGLDTKGEMDGFFAVAFGGAYRLFAVDLGQGSIGYDFYNSAHFQTAAYDLQNHQLHLDVATTVQGFVQMGASGYYDYYLLDYRSFFQQGRFVPWATFFAGHVAATQVYYQFTTQDYAHGSPQDPGPFSPFRDAGNNAFGIRQYFLLGAPDRSISLGYQWADNDPYSSSGTDFAYTDNIFELRGNFGILDWARAQVGYAFDLQDYEHRNSRTDFTKRRHDGQSQVVVQLTRDLTEYLSADLSYFGLFNSSNIPDFQYDRNIVQATLRVHF